MSRTQTIKTSTVRVVVIEDQRELRSGLQTLLNLTPNFRCEKSFGSMEDALRSEEIGAADLVLIDIGLPRMDGIEGTRILRERFPELPIVVLTVHGEDDKIFRALCAGANGYLLKNTPAAKIIEALTEVLDGGAPMTPSVARRVVQLFSTVAPAAKAECHLTEQERKILKMLADGHHYKTAAFELGISINTISFHLKKHLLQAASPLEKRGGRQSPARKINLKISPEIIFPSHRFR